MIEISPKKDTILNSCFYCGSYGEKVKALQSGFIRIQCSNESCVTRRVFEDNGQAEKIWNKNTWDDTIDVISERLDVPRDAFSIVSKIEKMKDRLLFYVDPYKYQKDSGVLEEYIVVPDFYRELDFGVRAWEAIMPPTKLKV